jgi:hypothetical protein
MIAVLTVAGYKAAGTAEESLRKRARPFNRDYERHSSNARRLLPTNLHDLVRMISRMRMGIPRAEFRFADLPRDSFLALAMLSIR